MSNNFVVYDPLLEEIIPISNVIYFPATGRIKLILRPTYTHLLEYEISMKDGIEDTDGNTVAYQTKAYINKEFPCNLNGISIKSYYFYSEHEKIFYPTGMMRPWVKLTLVNSGLPGQAIISAYLNNSQSEPLTTICIPVPASDKFEVILWLPEMFYDMHDQIIIEVLQ